MTVSSPTARSVPALLAALAALAVAGCAAGSGTGSGLGAGPGAGSGGGQGVPASSGPVHRQAPSVAPPATRGSLGCMPGVAPDAVAPRAGLPTVDPDPVGVTAVWLPGLGAEPCRAVLATHGAPVATRLAADIRAAPRFLPGARSCPLDEGSEVDLYFHYRSGGDERVRAKLSGCTAISAPGRYLRRSTDEIRRDLASIIPPAWRAVPVPGRG